MRLASLTAALLSFLLRLPIPMTAPPMESRTQDSSSSISSSMRFQASQEETHQ